ncbi:MAG: N-acetylmuramoyl-L-alanine amidase [Wujia sp.]
MAVKIMIDPGHGGSDPGAVYGDRLEKDDALALALAVGEILQGQGYDVEYTRTTDVYDTPFQKAQIANANGADFFVSIHRNSSDTPNKYNGVQTLIYDDSGIKAVMAENINKRLAEVGYRNINVVERPNLTVLKRTQMPAVLVEAGFINSDIDNNIWDNNFYATAEAIAKGIDETLKTAGIAAANGGNGQYATVNDSITVLNGNNNENDTGNSSNGKNGNNYSNNNNGNRMQNNAVENVQDQTKGNYQILVGIYRGFQSASYQMNRLMNDGYDADIYEDEGLFQVRVGDYFSLEDALVVQRELRDRGYSTLIVNAF